MTAKKSAPKSATKRVPGKPFVAADPRSGRGPAPGAPNAGRPPDEFRALMRSLVSRDDVVANLQRILTTPDHPDFMKAWTAATDRGYGKALQSLDVTSGGQALTREQIATMTPDQIRAEIAVRLAAL